MSEHDDLSGLSAALGRAAGGGESAYTARDVARSARRRRGRRAAGTGIVALALVAGIAVAVTGDDEPATTDTFGPTTSTTEPTTTEPPTTTDPGETTTTMPDGSVGDPACAAPLADRRPLPGPEAERAAMVVDLDGDGAADPFFYLPDDDLGGSWIQADRSRDGASTNPIRLDGIFGRETFVDAADLDGDTRDEAFLELAGNTLLTGVIVEIEGCELRAITTDDPAFDYGDGLFTYPILSGGNGCAPTGCITSVVCTDRVAGGSALEIVNAWPVVSSLDDDFDADDPTPWAELEVEVRYDAVVIEDGQALVAPAQGLTPPPVGIVEAGAPALAPWWELSGVHCDRLSPGAGECDVFPELRESDEWKLAEQAFVPGAPVQYAVMRRDDGAEVRITNPGPVTGPSHDFATIELPWGEGGVMLDTAGGATTRHQLRWPVIAFDVRPYCVRWSAWSDDLEADVFVAAVQGILGAGEPSWVEPPD